jgi:hypothetical protein
MTTSFLTLTGGPIGRLFWNAQSGMYARISEPIVVILTYFPVILMSSPSKRSLPIIIH